MEYNLDQYNGMHDYFPDFFQSVVFN